MGLDIRVVKELLGKDDPTIIEIGANRGTDTQRFLAEFRNIKLYCFEPDPRCVKVFKSNIEDERCVLIEAAVSNIDGTMLLNMSSGLHPGMCPGWINLFAKLRFHSLYYFLGNMYMRFFHKGWDQSSSIKGSISHPSSYPWLFFDKQVKVKTRRLDSWITENKISSIDFIWSDVQGAEKDMIEGGTEALTICKYILMEYGEQATYPDAMSRDETIKLLNGHNFRLVPEHSSKRLMGDLLFINNKFLNI